MLKKNKNVLGKKGFTLIELIVVIAILAILAAVAVPKLGGFQKQAKDTSDQQTALAVKNALVFAFTNGDIILQPSLATSVTDTITITSNSTGLVYTASGASGVSTVFAKKGATTPISQADLTTAIDQYLVTKGGKVNAASVVLNVSSIGEITLP